MLKVYVSLTSAQSFSNLTFSYGADLADVDSAVYTEGTFDVTPSNTSATPLYVESVSGSTTAVTPNVVTATSSTPLGVYNVGGHTYSGVTTTSTTAATMLSNPSAGYAYRLHAITMDYTGTASTTPVQALLQYAGSGAPFTINLAVLNYPYKTTVLLDGMLIEHGTTGTVVQIVNSTTTSTLFTLIYDTITLPTIS
jgi:hypothetical protein